MDMLGTFQLRPMCVRTLAVFRADVWELLVCECKLGGLNR